MEESKRDSTGDWLLPEAERPPLLSELEARIEEAAAIAKASERAAIAVGTAALDAAGQARRAAGIAERAAASALQAQYRTADAEDESLRGFVERANRIAARLRELSSSRAGEGRLRAVR